MVDCYIVIGGWGGDETPTTAIYMYDPATDSWVVISRMGTPRMDCYSIAAVFPNSKLMVVGGYTSAHGPTDSIEFASIAI